MIQLRTLRDKQVCDLDTSKYILLQDSQDMQSLKEYLGSPDWFEYDYALVLIYAGDYEEIHCGEGIPYLNQWVDTILVIEDTCPKCGNKVDIKYQGDINKYKAICNCGFSWCIP